MANGQSSIFVFRQVRSRKKDILNSLQTNEQTIKKTREIAISVRTARGENCQDERFLS